METVQSQVAEVASFQENLVELERKFSLMKNYYEDRITKLTAQLADQTQQKSAGAAGQGGAAVEDTLHPVSTLDKNAAPGGQQLPPVGQVTGAPAGTTTAGAGDAAAVTSGTTATTTTTTTAMTETVAEGTVGGAAAGAFPELKLIAQKTHDDWTYGYRTAQKEYNMELSLAHSFAHKSVVCSTRFSHDGKLLATGCDHTTQLYDLETGKKIGSFVVPSNGGTGTYYAGDSVPKGVPATHGDLYIRTVVFSPDDQLLATGAEDHVIRFWSVPHKRMVQSWTGHDLDVYSLEFMPDGKRIVSASGDNTVKVWDVETCKPLHTLGRLEIGQNNEGVTSVAVSPDGKYIATGSLDHVVRLWDGLNGVLVQEFFEHTEPVYSVAISPDGRTLATASLDKTVRLWDIERPPRACRITLAEHKDFALSVAFSPDGKWVVSGSKDRTVQFWDVATGAPNVLLQGHKNSVISVAFTPDSTGTCGSFVTGSGDNLARVWKYRQTTPDAAPTTETTDKQQESNSAEATATTTESANGDAQPMAVDNQ